MEEALGEERSIFIDHALTGQGSTAFLQESVRIAASNEGTMAT